MRKIIFVNILSKRISYGITQKQIRNELNHAQQGRTKIEFIQNSKCNFQKILCPYVDKLNKAHGLIKITIYAKLNNCQD